MGEKQVIETGIDKLLALIKKKKRISVADASKALGVSTAIAEEWGEFLQDEGYITREYSFTKPVFVLKTVDTNKVKEKAEDLEQKKEGFIKKAEVGLAKLDRDDDVIKSFKDDFEQLKSNINNELKDMQVEMGELERYEKLKDDINKKIDDQEKEFKKKAEGFTKEIEKEQKKFDDLVKKVDDEKEKLDGQVSKSEELKKAEDELENKITELMAELRRIKSEAKKTDKNVEESHKNVENLRSLSEKAKQEIESKRGESSKLIDQTKEYEKKVTEAQRELLNKIKKSKTMDLQKGKDTVHDRFKEFFKKKNEIDKMIKTVEDEKDQLQKELTEFIKKAKAFRVTTGSKKLDSEIKSIENHYKKADEKLRSYEKKMEKLATLTGSDGKKKKRSWFPFFR